MARFYTNKNLRRRIVEALRQLGHDVLTSYETGNANQSIPDDEVLNFARAKNRIIVTFNRQDFIRLHRQNPIHSGIVVCTEDNDHVALANRIHEAMLQFKDIPDNQLIRVNRPNKP